MQHSIERAVVEIFQEKREAFKMSQEELSISISKSSKTIYRLEKNYTTLSFDLFISLCDVFNLDPSSTIEKAKTTFSPIER